MWIEQDVNEGKISGDALEVTSKVIGKPSTNAENKLGERSCAKLNDSQKSVP